MTTANRQALATSSQAARSHQRFRRSATPQRYLADGQVRAAPCSDLPTARSQSEALQDGTHVEV
jgi:hypothetical protein